MEIIPLKPRTLFVVLLTTISQLATAQIFNGDLTLSSQSDVDNFKYSEVTGNLVIGQKISTNSSLTDIMDLNPLASLIRVGGVLSIQKTLLSNLKGLDQLTSVATLTIVANEQLEHIQNLASLSWIAEDLIIAVNRSLTTFKGLENVSGIGGLMDIEANATLTSLDGLNNLQTIGSWVVIDENYQLISFQGLESLKSVGGFFRIGGDHYQLQNIQALANLTTVGGLLSIVGNAKLTSLSGLDNLKSVESLTINDNPLLENLQGLGSLLSTRDITIWNNDQLLNLQGLNKITSVRSLQILFNPTLQNLTGLDNITTAIDIIIEGNNSLVSLKGMNIVAVKRLFNITENQSLESLEGLEKLKAVEGSSLVIGQNPQLKTLEALNSLEFAFSLILFENGQLTTLKGLENLNGVNNLSIFNNASLNSCCAITDVLLNRPSNAIEIRSNGENCSSLSIILQNCSELTSGFTLVDASTNQDIRQLNTANVPEIINLQETGNQLNIRADFGSIVGSVVFIMDDQMVRRENVFPFALFGNNPPLIYLPGSLPLGRHTLTAVPFSAPDGRGSPGTAMTIELLVIDAPQAITGFTLISSADGSDLMELLDGSEIPAQMVNNGVNIRANTYGSIGSVVFDLNDVDGVRVENVAPYALGGDLPVGNYFNTPSIQNPGKYYLTATPYTLRNGRGSAGTPLSVSFEVIDDQPTASGPNIQTYYPKGSDVGLADLRIYPNPTRRLLTVERNGFPDALVQLSLSDQLGKIVWKGNLIEGHSGQFDLGDLLPNMYFLKIKSDQYIGVKKILVE